MEQNNYDSRERNCGTQIRDSLVVIVCGDVEMDHKKKFSEMSVDEGNYMDHDKYPCEKEECGCRIEIKDSRVVILCGDVDFDKVKKCIKETFDEVKGNEAPASQE